jgi:phytoene dehydrogenase-like protein
MEKRCDAVVIGAGLGGLTAAALLAGEGLKVLVVEKASHPGGTAYTYRRKGFAFPMGPLGFSNPDLVRKILEGVGVEEDLELRRVSYLLSAFGQKVRLSQPFQDLVAELATLYPAERKGISKFFNDIREINNTLRDPGGVSSPKSPQLIKASAAAYLDRTVRDRHLRRILGSMGTREPYSGMPLLAAMWDLLCEKGVHYPKGGMRHLCDILTEAVEGGSRSGLIRLGAEAAEIIVEGGRAAGVIMSDGKAIGAGGVISNADFKTTFLRLVPSSKMPPELLQAVSQASQTMSNLQVCLGLDPSRVDLSAFDEGSRIIHRRDGLVDMDEEGVLIWDNLVIDPDTLAGEEMEIDLLSRDEPLLAPPGKAVMVIRVAADYRHFARFRTQYGKRKPGYVEYKTRLAQGLVAEASKLAPGLADAIEVMDVATPLTFEERGGRSEGAVAGWSWDYSVEHGGDTKELVLTPIARLYMAGYQAFSMLSLGGVPSAMQSGVKAARYLLEGAGPYEWV